MLGITIARVVLILVCLTSLVIMGYDLFRHRDAWNMKTRDYWYGRVMWTVTGVSAGVEGIIRHTSFRYSFVFLMVAALVTLKANVQRGQWGSDDRSN